MYNKSPKIILPLSKIEDYDYVLTLPKAAIAWEYLRRNIDYQRDRFNSKADYKVDFSNDSNLRIIRKLKQNNSCLKWGLSFFQ